MGIHDRHLAAAIGVLVEHADGGLHEERDGVVVTAVGAGGDEFNTAWVTRAPEDPATFDWACELLAATGSPWMVQGPEAALRDIERVGLQERTGAPMMVRPATVDLPAVPDGLRIELAQDADMVVALGRGMATGFGSPDPDAMRGALLPSLADDDRVLLFGGWVGDDLVATSVGVVAEGVGGIYGVTVQPTARRRGFGAAITWAAVGAVSAFADSVVLQASAMGESVYRSMGFETVHQYRRFGP